MPVSVGQIVVQLGANTQKFTLDLDRAQAKLAQTGQSFEGTLKKLSNSGKQFGRGVSEGSHKAVTGVQATSAALRTLEGNMTNNLRAAERWVASLPGVSSVLKAAFPAVGAIAFTGILDELAERVAKVTEALKQMETAPQRIAAAFNGINAPLRRTNDELAVSNDKLTNEIAKLQGKPQNGLQLALDEARVAADNLSDSLLKDLSSVSKLFEQNPDHWYESFTGKASTGFIKDAIQGKDGFGGFQQQITEITLKANQQLAAVKTPADADKIRQQERVQLEKAYGDQIAWANQQLKERQALQAQFGKASYANTNSITPNISGFTATQTQDQQKSIAELQGLLQNLYAARNSIALQYQNESLTRTRDALQIDNNNSKLGNKGPLDYNAVSLRAFQVGLAQQGKAAEKWQTTLGNIQKLGTEMAISVNASLDNENQKRLQTLAILNEQVDTARKLASLGSSSSYAERALREQEQLSKIKDPAQKSLTGQLFSYNDQAESNRQISSIDQRTESLKRLASVATLGRDAQRQAQLDEIRKSGQDQIDALNKSGLDPTLVSTQTQIIQQQTAARLSQLQAQFNLQDAQSGRSWTASDGMKKYFSEMRDNVQSTGQMVHDVLGGAFQSLNDSLERLVAGQNVTWSSFFRGLASQIASLGLNNLEGNLLGGLFGGSTTATTSHGSGIGGFLATLFGGFRASGGSVDPNKAYVVGEQGPEIWSPPGGGGTIIPNNKLGANGGSGSAMYYIDARGADAASVEQRVQRSLAAVHGSAVRNAVAVQHEMAKRSPAGTRR